MPEPASRRRNGDMKWIASVSPRNGNRKKDSRWISIEEIDRDNNDRPHAGLFVPHGRIKDTLPDFAIMRSRQCVHLRIVRKFWLRIQPIQEGRVPSPHLFLPKSVLDRIGRYRRIGRMRSLKHAYTTSLFDDPFEGIRKRLVMLACQLLQHAIRMRPDPDCASAHHLTSLSSSHAAVRVYACVYSDDAYYDTLVGSAIAAPRWSFHEREEH